MVVVVATTMAMVVVVVVVKVVVVVVVVVMVMVMVVGGGSGGGGDSDRDGGGRREPYVPPPLLRFSVVPLTLTDRPSSFNSRVVSFDRPLFSRPGWYFRHGRPPGFSSGAPNALSRELRADE